MSERPEPRTGSVEPDGSGKPGVPGRSHASATQLTPEPPSSPLPSPPSRALLVVAAVLLAVAGVLGYGNLTMTVAGRDGAFGPRTVPWIVVVLCLVVAVLLVLDVVRSPHLAAHPPHDPMTARATAHDPFDETFTPTVLADRPAGGIPESEASEAPNYRALATAVAGLVAFTVLVEPLGWLASATLLFVVVAHGLGGRRYGSMALVGLGLAALIQVVFSGLLDLTLPPGILGG